jgi:hypothetical protein
LAASSVCLGAEIRKAWFSDGELTQIEIIGEIVEGDARRFQSVLDVAKGFVQVRVASPGGDLAEAMKIGRVVRENFLPVHAPTFTDCAALNAGSITPEAMFRWPKDVDKSVACQCYSACFVIWASGVLRVGGSNPMSKYGFDGPTGARSFVGIHRAKFAQEYYSELSADEAQREYSQLNQVVTRYLDEMDVPRSLIERMWSVPSTELYLLSDEDLELVTGWLPALDEWLESKCDQLRLTVDEQIDRAQLMYARRALSGPEESYKRILDEKWGAHVSCRSEAGESEQKRRRGVD